MEQRWVKMQDFVVKKNNEKNMCYYYFFILTSNSVNGLKMVFANICKTRKREITVITH